MLVEAGCVVFPWLFNVYKDCVVKLINARVLGKEWNFCVRMHGVRFEINLLLVSVTEDRLDGRCM